MQTAKQAVKQFVVEGVHLISQKTLGMMLEIIKLSNMDGRVVNGLKIVADGQLDGGCVGQCDSDTGEIRLDVKQIIDEMIEYYGQTDGKPEERHISMRAEFILQLLLILGHEIGHLLKIAEMGVGAYRMKPTKWREDTADATGADIMLLALEKFDVEPVALADEPYLMVRLQEAMIQHQHAAWVYRERMLAAKGLMFDNGEMQFKTLREFAEHKWQDRCNWKQATYPVRVEFNPNEKGESKVYENDLPEPGLEACIDENTEIIGLEVEMGAEGSYIEVGEDNSPGGEVYEGPAMAPAPAINTAVPVQAPPTVVAGASFLPPHLTNPAAAGAAGVAAVSGQAQVNKEPKMYPPNAHDQARILEFMMAVYQRLYAHIFTHCGWTGTPGGMDWHFSDPTGVISKPVNIADLIHAYGMPDVVMEYNTHGADGRKIYAKNGTAEKCNGYIRGEIFSTSKLPGYTVFINVHGLALKRVLTPQNTTKDSTTALKARAGHCIAFLIKGDEGVAENDKWIGRFEDNVWMPSRKK